MPGNAVYLEAPERTQDLLNRKWTLRSAGYAIGSSWHEGEVNTSPLAFQDHWNARGVEQLQVCDSLVVVCGKNYLLDRTRCVGRRLSAFHFGKRKLRIACGLWRYTALARTGICSFVSSALKICKVISNEFLAR
jgi:hypothetical protein